MKSILGNAALAFAILSCNLADKLANRNTSQNNNEEPASSTKNGPAGGETTGRSETNTASPVENVSPPPPPQPGASGNDSDTDSANTVSGGVLDDKAVSKPEPAYPPVAKAVRASGRVTVRVTVDENGNVISARATSGHPLLRAAAEQAARQARFNPTDLAAKPAKVTGILTYDFKPQ
jgi:TonB family protein